jgi:SAM-dependent methyltransferase
VLRGRRATAAELGALVPGASAADVEAVLDLSLAARYVRGELAPGDVAGAREPASASDLAFRRLRFPGATPRIGADLPEAGYDRAVASLLLSYLFQPGDAVAEVHRALRPGGIFVCSSLKPNFDFSETHVESMRRIAEMPADALPPGETRESLLAALRGFSSYVATLVELEEQGAFRFLDAAALHQMLARAGFTEIQVFDGLGDPGQAVIARGVKARGGGAAS